MYDRRESSSSSVESGTVPIKRRKPGTVVVFIREDKVNVEFTVESQPKD